MQKCLKEQAKEVAALLLIKDKLLFALVREHPEVWDEVLKDKELYPYAELLQTLIDS